MTATFRDDAYSPEVANGYEMLLPSGLDIKGVADDEGCGDLHDRFSTAGGADVGDSFVRLVFENGASVPAVLSDIDVRVVDRTLSSFSTQVVCTHGAGPLAPPQAVVNLDDRDPTLRAVKGSSTGWMASGPYFRNQVVTLAPGKSFAIDVLIESDTCECGWKFVGTATVGGRSVTATADDAGQPFRIMPADSVRRLTCWSNMNTTGDRLTLGGSCGG